MFENGTKCKFDTHGGDSGLNYRTGESCVIIRPVTQDEADIFDVGNMYRVRFSDGVERDAFEDELSI